VRNTAHVHL